MKPNIRPKAKALLEKATPRGDGAVEDAAAAAEEDSSRGRPKADVLPPA
jgi:hypothetical protein